MIPYNQEQRLGKRGFLVLLFQRSMPAIVVLVIDCLIIAFNSYIQQGVGSAIYLGSINNNYFVTNLPVYLLWLVLALFFFSIILLMVGYIIAHLIYINYTFTIQEFDLKLKRGILNIEEISIPYRQMQDININRSLLYRFLGVSKIIIDSAGQEEKDEDNETDIILEPIDKAVASEIQELLERKIGVQVVENEKVVDKEVVTQVTV